MFVCVSVISVTQKQITAETHILHLYHMKMLLNIFYEDRNYEDRNRICVPLYTEAHKIIRKKYGL